jgi:hypothetical protein
MSTSNLAQDLAKEGTGTFVNLLSNSAQFWKLNVAMFFTRTYKTVVPYEALHLALYTPFGLCRVCALRISFYPLPSPGTWPSLAYVVVRPLYSPSGHRNVTFKFGLSLLSKFCLVCLRRWRRVSPGLLVLCWIFICFDLVKFVSLVSKELVSYWSWTRSV